MKKSSIGGLAITVLNTELGNFWIADIISSLVFAPLHIPRYGLDGFVKIGIIGLLLMTLFITTRNIYPAMLTHMLSTPVEIGRDTNVELITIANQSILQGISGRVTKIQK